MVTLGKVKAEWEIVAFDIAMYGAEAEFLRDNKRLLRAIGDALRADRGLSVEEAKALPHDIVLKGDALARYEEWKGFLLSHKVPA